MSKFSLKCFIFFLGLFLIDTAHAATITASASGQWKTSATWVGGVVPTTNDIAIIPAGITVTYSITVNNTLGYESFNNPVINVYGTIVFFETTAINETSVRFINTANITIYSGGVFQDNLVPDSYYFNNNTTTKIIFNTGAKLTLGSNSKYPNTEFDIYNPTNGSAAGTPVDINPQNGPFTVATDGVTGHAPTFSTAVTTTPTLTTPANNSSTTVTTPTFSGTATANSTVTSYVDGSIVGTTIATSGGAFSFTQPTALGYSSHTAYAIAQSGGVPGSANSNTNTFTVAPVAPTVTTSSASSITTTTTVLGGNVTADGGAAVTDRGVVYVLGNGTPTTSNTKAANGTGTGTFSQTITGLSSNNTYSVRAYAINSVGTSYGTTQTFTTQDVPPVVTLSSGNASYTVGGSSSVVDGGLTVTDADNTTLTSGTVTVANLISGDMLGFTNQNGITGSYNSGTGILTLSGSASLANYQAALRSIVFQSTGTSTTTRNISFIVSDGISNSTTVTRSITVNPPPATVTATGTLSAVNTTYGSASATPTSFTVSGTNLASNLVVTAPTTDFEVSTASASGYGASVNLTPTSGTVANTTIYLRLKATTVVGNYGNGLTVNVTSTGAATKTLSTVTSAVSAAPLTITANNQSKVYGAALPTLTASYTGFVNGENSSALSTQPTLSTAATAASHISGSPYSITASGAASANYTITYVSGSLTITTAPLTITANNQTKVYGAALPTLTASYTGFVNGDSNGSLTTPPTLSTTATASSTVAGNPYSITASGAVDADYTISYVSGSLSVTTAPLTITANNQTKVYGAALPTLTASYTGFVNGNTSSSLTTLPTLSTTATSVSHISGSPYSITASGAASANYTISYVAGSLTITTAPLTITASNQTKVYGAALPTLTVNYTGFVNGDGSSNLTTLPTLTTTATASSNVAGNPYSITASGAVDPDYTISYVSGSLSVTTAPLTITANNQTKVYGAALPTLTASYTGFVNGNTSSSLTTLPTLSTTATAASHISGSPYSITASGAASANYTISYVAGSLTITPALLTITANNQTKVYGAPIPALTASYSGFVNGDNNGSLTTLPTLNTTATASSSVAGNPYSITASGAVDGDYNIGYVAGTLTVTQATATLTLSDLTQPYDGLAKPVSVTTTPAGLNTVNVTYNGSATAPTAPGSYPVIATLNNSDYTAPNATGTLIISQPIYYTKSTGDLSILSTYGTSADGTGTAPTDFNGSGLSGTYQLANRATYALSSSLVFGSNGTLNIPGGTTFNLAGNSLSLTNLSGSGSFGGSNTSSLIVNGTLTGLSFAPGKEQLGTLSLGNAASVTLTSALNIASTGAINLAANSILSTGGFLTLKSDIAGTALVSPLGTGATIGGNVTVERYIADKRAWRLITAPVNSTQTINAAWQEGAISISSDPNPGYGTFVIGDNTNNGFDIASTSGSLLTYSGGVFNNIANTNSITLSSNPGYFLFSVGNRSSPPGAGTHSATVLRSTGTLRAGTQTLPIAASGYTLIGNPYAAPVDFSQVGKSTSVPDRFYAWDINLGSYGAYVLVTNTGGTYTSVPASPSGLDNIIASGAAIIVQSDGTNAGSLTFNEASKSTVAGSGAFSSFVAANNTQHNFRVNLTDGNAKLIDGVLANFAARNSNAVDGNDATKLSNFYENMSLNRSGKLLSMEIRKDITTKDSIFIQFSGMKATNYVLQIDPSAFNETGTMAYLDDAYLNTHTKLDLSNISDIPFIANSDPKSYQNRFDISFTPPANDVTIKTSHAGASVIAYPNPATQKQVNLWFDGLPVASYNITIMDSFGHIVQHNSFVYNGTAGNKLLITNYATGVYTVNIQSVGYTQSIKVIVQ